MSNVPTTSVAIDVTDAREYAMPKPVTASPAILKKQRVQIPAIGQSVYRPSAQNIIRFIISDANSVWLANESFISFDVHRLQASNEYDNYARLDQPNIQALIKSIEIRLNSTRTLIQRQERYNNVASILQRVGIDEVSDREGFIYSGKPHDFSKDDPSVSSFGNLIGTYTSGDPNAAVLTRTAGTYIDTDRLENGDYIMLIAADGTVLVRAVSSYKGSEITLASAAADTDTVYTLYHLPKNNRGLERSNVAAVSYTDSQAWSSSNSVATCMFRPLMSFLEHEQHMYLLKGGLEISVELEYGDRAFVSGEGPAASSTAIDYFVVNPVYHCVFSTPDQAVIQEYVNRWNSETGLIYYAPTFMVRSLQGKHTEGTGNLVLYSNIGVRSARFVITTVYDSDMNANQGQLARASRSLSDFFRTGISRFQYKVGSSYFPLQSVEYHDSGRIAYADLQRTLNQFFNSSIGFRVPEDEWRDNRHRVWYNTSDASLLESHSFMMAADLSRTSDNQSGPLSGLDLSLVPLQLEIERSATYASRGLPGNPDYTMYILYDSFVRIFQGGVVILN